MVMPLVLYTFSYQNICGDAFAWTLTVLTTLPLRSLNFRPALLPFWLRYNDYDDNFPAYIFFLSFYFFFGSYDSCMHMYIPPGPGWRTPLINCQFEHLLMWFSYLKCVVYAWKNKNYIKSSWIFDATEHLRRWRCVPDDDDGTSSSSANDNFVRSVALAHSRWNHGSRWTTSSSSNGVLPRIERFDMWHATRHAEAPFQPPFAVVAWTVSTGIGFGYNVHIDCCSVIIVVCYSKEFHSIHVIHIHAYAAKYARWYYSIFPPKNEKGKCRTNSHSSSNGSSRSNSNNNNQRKNTALHAAWRRVNFHRYRILYIALW